MARLERKRYVGRLFAGNVTTKGLGLDPVHEDEDTVASCFSLVSEGFLFVWSLLPLSMQY
jgi:hypothetical protein